MPPCAARVGPTARAVWAAAPTNRAAVAQAKAATLPMNGVAAQRGRADDRRIHRTRPCRWHVGRGIAAARGQRKQGGYRHSGDVHRRIMPRTGACGGRRCDCTAHGTRWLAPSVRWLVRGCHAKGRCGRLRCSARGRLKTPDGDRRRCRPRRRVTLSSSSSGANRGAGQLPRTQIQRRSFHRRSLWGVLISTLLPAQRRRHIRITSSDIG